MKLTSLFFILSCALLSSSVAQTVDLLPWLSGNVYGLADADGKVLVTPVYEEIATFPGVNIALAKKNGAWGVINHEGQVLVDFIMHGDITRTRDRYDKIYIEKAFRKILLADSERYLNVPLYMVRNPEQKCLYYVYADNPGIQQMPFISAGDILNKYSGTLTPNPVNTGIIKVGTMDHRINLLNTSGIPLLKESVVDADAYSEFVIGVYNDEGKIGLFATDLNQLSDYVYDRVDISEDGYFISCRKKKDSNGKTIYTYDLFDANGRLLLEDRAEAKGLARRIMDKDSSHVYLRDVDTRILASFENARLFMSILDTNHIRIHRNGKTGIIDRNGKYLTEIIYDDINFVLQGNYAFLRGYSSGLLDKQMKEMWSRDSIHVGSELTHLPGYYTIRLLQPNTNLHGIIKEDGTLIVPPMYNACHYLSHHNFFVVHLDSLQGVISTDGRILFPPETGEFGFDEEIYTFQSLQESRVYNNKFELLYSRDRFEEELNLKRKEDVNPGKPPKSLVCLVNSKGEEVSVGEYSEFKRIQDFSSKKWGYLARTFGYERFNELLGVRGQKIIPEGYELNLLYVQSSVGKEGPLIVVHKEDARSILPTPRIGLINFDGQWVIPPARQMIAVIGNALIVVINTETKKQKLYDRLGNYIHDKSYHYFISTANSGIENNRIRIGIPVNEKAYAVYLNKITAKGLNIPQDFPFYYGAINVKGEEVIPVKYEWVNEFHYPEICVKGVDDKGVSYYAILDTNGRELLRTEKELQLVAIQDSLVYYTENGKKGLLRYSGEVFVEPLYDELRIEGAFVIGKDSLQHYAIPLTNPVKRFDLGTDEYIEVDKFQDEYFRIENFSHIKDLGRRSQVNFFTKDGKFLSKVTNIGNEITYKYWQLPSGHCAIYDSKNSKPYIINFVTGMKYKN